MVQGEVVVDGSAMPGSEELLPRPGRLCFFIPRCVACHMSFAVPDIIFNL